MKKHIWHLAIVGATVAMLVLAFVNLGSSSSGAKSTETVSTARKGIVLSSVTATGNVEAPTSLSVSFQQSGRLKSISVHVGEHLTAGQEIARVDDTQQQASLKSATSSLVAAKAALAAKVRGETSYERSQDAASAASAAVSVTSAQSGVTRAEQTAAVDAAKNQLQVDQSQASLTAAQTSERAAKATLDSASSSLRSLQSSYDPHASSSESDDARLNRYRLDQVDCTKHSSNSSYKPSDGVTCSQLSNLTTFATNVQSDRNAYSQAQSSTTTADTALANAKANQVSAAVQDQQAIDNAKEQVTSSQAQYESTLASNAVKQAPAKPEDLAQARASVASAEQQVASAQQSEDQTTLTAPTSGTVASLSGTLGEYVSGGGGSSSAASSSSSSSTSSSSTSGFVTLTDISVLDVKVGFTETDASKVRIGEEATITLDAVPNKTFTGAVQSLDTDQTVVNNVVTYYAKVSIERATSAIKPGMTASVAVVLDKREAVVTLPTSAVPSSGTNTTVTVRDASGKETTRTIAIGLRGDSAVEISSGLSAGDKVISKSSATSGGVGGLPGGGGPPGGGGLGGGLGGGR